MGEAPGVGPGEVVAWEDLVPFGERSVRLTAGGWPFFRLAVRGLDGEQPPEVPVPRAALLLRPAGRGGFALLVVGLDADGAVRVERSAFVAAGDDFAAAWASFAGLRADPAALRAWLNDNPAALAVLSG